MKKLLLSLALVLGLGSTSCMGPNNAFNGINNWNAEVTEMEWLNEVIYLGLWIVPVYELAFFGDQILFNTVDYWGSDNMIKDPGLFPESFGDGK